MSDAETNSIQRIDAARKVLRGGAEQFFNRGFPIEDLAIAALYVAFDLAEIHAGYGQGAIEWLRTGADMIERSVTSGAPRVDE